MLHNNGTFAPSEAPVNMSASVNTPQMGAPILAHNFAAIAKNPQENTLPAPQTYIAPNFPVYGQQELSLGSEINPYTPFQNFHFGATQSVQNLTNYHENSMHKLQNLLMSGPDIHSPNAMNFSNVYNKQGFSSGSEQSQSSVQKNLPLHIPQIHTKAFHKQIGLPVQNQINFNDNLPFYSEEFRNSKPGFPTFEEQKHNSQSNISTEEVSSNTQKSQVKQESQSTISRTQPKLDFTIETLEQSSVSKSTVNVPNFTQDTQSTISKSQPTISNSSYKETSNSKSELQLHIENKPLVSSLLKTEIMGENDVEVDFNNPFIRDPHGVESKVEVEEESVERAVEDIQNATRSTYKCAACSLVFSHPKRYLIHHKWHSFGLKVKKGRTDRRNEELCENGEFECKDCNKFYFTKGALRNHRFKFHSGNRQCTVCDIVLPNWRALKTHTESQHMAGEVYKCHECDKVFKHRHTLARHSKVHNEKTLPCDQCPKLFGSQLQLKTHMKSHERAVREHSHHCSFCGKGYHEAFYLQVHERSHRNEKPFVCDICDAAYSTNSSLQRHYKVSHNSEAKPFECTYCHRFFSSENIKDRHEIRYHQSEAKLKYSCAECPEKFLKAKDLTKHVCRTHPKSRKRRNKNE